MKTRIYQIVVFCFFLSVKGFSQDVDSIVYGYAQPPSEYIWPEEPVILEKISQWLDLKFGVIIHWGLYSELGICESWPICVEEVDWIPRDTSISYDAFKRKYWSTIETFKPVNFDPYAWAELCKTGGMKYLLFTAKHHDGFNMFNTQQTDFSITKGIFKDDPRSNVTEGIMDAFRKEGFMVGYSFSKPDWHSQDYWWDYYATIDRNVNYKIFTPKNQPRWERFKTFTYNQIEELMRDYGKIDILWLDGGWIRKERPGDREAAGKWYKGEQDIDMPKISQMVRKYQPEILIVDRNIPGEFENYQTHERGISPVQLDHPWECCIALGDDWGYTIDDHSKNRYKSATKIIHMLAETTAKGGNMVLGIGPNGKGEFIEVVKNRVIEIGSWLSKNGEAIYNTRTTPLYNDGQTWFTQHKEGDTMYAIACFPENESLPKTIVWKGHEPESGTEMICLETGKSVKWKKTTAGIEVAVPAKINKIASVFSFVPANNNKIN